MNNKAIWALAIGSWLLMTCFVATATMKPSVPETWPSGILSDFSVPFSSESVRIENMWQRDIEGELVQVYAGSLAYDPEQGIVIVVVMNRDDRDVKGERILSKEKNGALKIVEENGGKLILKSEKGVSYEFDWR